MAKVTNANTKFLAAHINLAKWRGFTMTDRTAVDEFGDFTILNLTFVAEDGRTVILTARLGARNSVTNLRALVSRDRNDEGRPVLEELPAFLTTSVTETMITGLSLAE